MAKRPIGLDAHLKRLQRMGGAGLDRTIKAALYHAGETIQVEAQIGISAGAVSGKNHVPGPVGGYPNYDTGHLADNIRVEPVSDTEVRVTSNAEYAKDLEFGTSKMGARPHMRLARDAKEREVRKNVVDRVSRFIKTSGGGA